MPGISSLPSLSQVQAWDTNALSQAATFWGNTADSWEEAFDKVARDMPLAGGTSAWEGEAGDAAVGRAHSDQAKVHTVVDDLRRAATIARNAVDELDNAKRQALHAIGAAQAEGFAVGEDLSVTDQQTSSSPAEQAARQVKAESFASDIHAKAAALASADQTIAQDIGSAAATVADISFPESPETNGAIQAVDYKQSPADPNDDIDDRNPNYPDHRTNGEWAPGNSGVDGKAAADKTFDDLEEAGVPLVRQEVTVTVTDPETGKTYSRKYDALEPTGVPGQYIGIEHKVNKSPVTPNQRVVDDLVRSGVPARGTLNGQPIEVTNAAVLRVQWPPAESAPPPAAIDSRIPESIVQGAPPIQQQPQVLPSWGTDVLPEQAREGGGEIGNLQDFIDAFDPPPPPPTA